MLNGERGEPTFAGDLLRRWLGETDETQVSFAARAGVHPTYINHWINRRRYPSQAQEGRIEELTDGRVPRASWRVPEAPAEPPPPPREIGTTMEELRRSLENLARASEAPGVTPSQRATLEGRKIALLKEFRRLEDSRPIYEHRAFAGLVDDLVEAVIEVLGPRAPDGIEAAIANAFERMQAARAGAAPPPMRKAA